MFDAHGVRYAVHEDKMFRSYGVEIRPFGPASMDFSISDATARRMLRELRGWLLRWTNGFGGNRSQEYYAAVCDRFFDLASMSSHIRSQVRRGLKSCEARRVDAHFIAEHGYEVYARAYERYRNVSSRIWSPDAFRSQIEMTVDYSDIIHYWGVFHGDVLIGFSVNNVYDRIEAAYTMVKLHPDYLKLYPMYALIYRMNEFYLDQQGFEYVNDGWRSLLHESSVQEFLISKFGFHKAHADVSVCYGLPLAAMITVTWPFRSVLGSWNAKLKALYTLEETRRSASRTA